MNIYFAGIIISLVFYILIGIYAGRKVKNIEDYYVSGRNAPTFILAGTLFASMLSTNGFMGDASYAYGGNITTMILINAICASGYVLGPLFFGRYIRRAKATTMPGYFGDRFNSKRIRTFSGAITIIALLVYLLAVMQATSILMQTLTGYDNITCLIISLSCVIIFTVYSGSEGVLLTNTAMFLIFIGGTILASPYVFQEAGGLENLIINLKNNSNTPQGLLDYHGNLEGSTKFNNIFYAVTIGVMWSLTVGVSPWQCGRNLMAKNEHVILRSGAVASILTVVFLTYLYLMAIAVIMIYPNMPNPERVLIWAAYEKMPTIVGAFFLSGIMAAGLSSASTFLSVISFSLASDVLNLEFKNNKSQLLFNRITMFLVGLLATLLACLNLSSIRVLTWFSGTLIAASWAYVAFASVWSKKITERGAYYAMFNGFFGYILTKFIFEFNVIKYENLFDPFFIALAISWISGIYFSKGQTKTKEEIEFFSLLHKVPEEEINPKEYKIDKIYGWGLVVCGIILCLVFINFWAIPYNSL